MESGYCVAVACSEVTVVDCFHAMFGMVAVDTYAVCGDSAVYLSTEVI